MKGAARSGAWIGFAAVFAFSWLATGTLEGPQRLTVLIATATVLFWVFALIDKWLTGAVAVLALWASGSIGSTNIAAAATHDLVLLLIIAYVISFAIRRVGLLNAIAYLVLRRPTSFSGLACRFATLVAATAFIIPATSARATMLLPIHQMLAASLPDAGMRRALALLTPSIVLLSAGGVMTGAAAHVVALEMISISGGPGIGYWHWMVLALPVALLTCAAAVWLILVLFLDKSGSKRRIATSVLRPQALTRTDRAILATIAATVLLWITNGWHGVELATIGLAAALVILALVRLKHPVSAAEIIQAVDWKALVFLISTVLIAEALLTSGAVATIATALLRAIPVSILGSSAATIGAVGAIAILAHILLPSRSARAAILIPTMALPLSKACHDITTLALVIVLGTGFCQLVPYGAKPLMIFAGGSASAEFQRDLVRLGLPLLFISWSVLVAFAQFIWPLLDVFSASTGNRV